MIKANFNTYNSYVTDSLYQWDLNQTLSVPGLNLATAPEVHFSNANMDKAIVRQATLTNGVVYVDIPNSLLQDPLTIKAYIGIYEGATFKVIEEISIPIRPKERPADYRIESTDGEIYSFEALRNALGNKADNARVDNIIAHNNDSEGNTELIDIRLDADGVFNGSAGEAVRKQINSAMVHISDKKFQELFFDSIELGKAWNFISGGLPTVSEPGAVRALVPRFRYWLDLKISVSTGYYIAVILLDDSLKCVKDSGWTGGVVTVNAFNHFIMNVRRLDNNAMSAEELKNAFTITLENPNVKELQDRLDNNDTRLARLESNIDDHLLTDLFLSSIEIGSVWNYNSGSVITSDLITSGVRAKSPVTSYLKDITVSALDGYRISVILLDDSLNCESETGWTDKIVTIPAYKKFALSARRTDEGVLGEVDIANILTMKRIINPDDRADIISSILVEYGRKNGASYVFVRIPKTTNDGKKISPKIKLTSSDGSIAGAKRSTLRYSIDNNLAFVINGGLFDTTTNQPIGQTIIDGVSIVNEPHAQGANGETISDTECYPLCIDANGVLSAPYDRYVDTADMISDGIVQAISGWGKLVENYAITEEDIEAEIVHPGRYCRQAIGQYQNGDYCVCTVDMSGYSNGIENEAGLTYTELAQIFVDKGVKFAYSLDGGGSAETVIGSRQLNAIYEGTEGRIAPTVISFEVE